MKNNSIIIGVAPTRRNIFSKDSAMALKTATYTRLSEIGINYVNIEDINSEGLLFQEEDVEKIVAKFSQNKVDALFFPHTNFGTEDLVCKVAAALNKPVLIWGPRDGAPNADGSRLTDSQCGLFATGKVLRRFRIPFNYMTNCEIESDVFVQGIKTFEAVANVVKEFRTLKILQISNRPKDFWTMMCNEGELLERFGIQIVPVPMPDITDEVKILEKQGSVELDDCVKYLYENTTVCISDEKVRTIAALKLVMRKFADENKCKAIAIECWHALQRQIGIMPCASNGLLTDEGIPVVCETDIHGAITSVLTQAAAMGKRPTFFADWTVRHPENNNGELLQHCGPFPISLARGEKKLVVPFVFGKDHPGSVIQEVKPGEITITRFDGDNGKYSMLAGRANIIDGPYNAGSYCWIEVKDWPRLERKLVEGPYVHHCVGIHGDILPVLSEAQRYLGFDMDFYDNDEPDRIMDYLLYGNKESV